MNRYAIIAFDGNKAIVRRGSCSLEEGVKYLADIWEDRGFHVRILDTEAERGEMLIYETPREGVA